MTTTTATETTFLGTTPDGRAWFAFPGDDMAAAWAAFEAEESRQARAQFAEWCAVAEACETSDERDAFLRRVDL